MSYKRCKHYLVVAIAGALLNSASVSATTVNWSDITLSGSFPNFSFSNSVLGLVNLSYSNDTEVFGIQNALGGVDTLQLGNTGGESLILSWANPIENLNIPIWDIDAIPGTSGESVTFTTTATISPVSLHTSDEWIFATQTLSHDGTANPNGDPNNFSVLNFTSATGFDSIRFDWAVEGTGRMGIGEIQVVPLPPAVFLFAVGILGIFSFARSKE